LSNYVTDGNDFLWEVWNKSLIEVVNFYPYDFTVTPTHVV
jgi:hypothetical protein